MLRCAAGLIVAEMFSVRKFIQQLIFIFLFKTGLTHTLPQDFLKLFNVQACETFKAILCVLHHPIFDKIVPQNLFFKIIHQPPFLPQFQKLWGKKVRKNFLISLDSPNKKRGYTESLEIIKNQEKARKYKKKKKKRRRKKQ